MTRRDYILLSDTLREAVKQAAPREIDGLHVATLAIADAITGRNPAFDKPRFLRDSGFHP